MFYLLQTPTSKWYYGESVRKLADVYNASLVDKRLHVQRSNLYALLRGEIKNRLHKLCEITAYESRSDIPLPPDGVKLFEIV